MTNAPGEPSLPGEDPNSTFLRYTGRDPASGVRSIFAARDKWKIDCFQFVQLTLWHAALSIIGDERFNDLITKSGRPLELHSQTITPFPNSVLYFRNEPNSPFQEVQGPIKSATPDMRTSTKTDQELLRAAPVGSRVAFGNIRLPDTSDFRHENVVKTGENKYATHGLGLEGRTISRQELESRLALKSIRLELDIARKKGDKELVDAFSKIVRMANADFSSVSTILAAYARQYIYVEQIQSYQLPH